MIIESKTLTGQSHRLTSTTAKQPRRRMARLCAGLTVALLTAGSALSQDATPTTTAAPDTAFIFNTMLFLIMGMVVMFMAAGFCMLEAGMVRSKNAATICLKNITLYSIATVMVWLIGYNLIYGNADTPGGWIGTLGAWGADDSKPLDLGFASSSDWFFQMVFVATAASIVSGTMAERVRLWPFFLFTALLTGVILSNSGFLGMGRRVVGFALWVL